MIAQEGRIILIPLFIVMVVLFGVQSVYPSVWLYRFNWLLVALFVFCLYFFRLPVRTLPADESAFISPADGKIVQIMSVEDKDLGKVKQISIFLSVFNVHKQWVPFSGKVLDKRVIHGKFLAAFNHKASLDNEQTWTLLETDSGIRYKIKQIAGLIARRVLNDLSAGDSVAKGDKLGFIRFGSRVDILVPEDFMTAVNLGDRVKGGSTIIGYFK